MRPVSFRISAPLVGAFLLPGGGLGAQRELVRCHSRLAQASAVAVPHAWAFRKELPDLRRVNARRAAAAA